MTRPAGMSAGRLEDRFVVAAGLIVATIIATAVAGDHRIGQIIYVVIQSLTLYVIMHASGVPARTIRITAILIAIAAVGTAISVSIDRQSVGPGVVGATLALAGPIVIIRRVRTHVRIDFNTVAASLCVYLLAGMFFASVYRVLNIVDGPFFVQHATAQAVDFVYFSFTTLTTLGYGDLTARTNLARMLAISEALMGQLYLVSVVAVLVANIGQSRRSAGDAEADGVDG
ncbi:MAG: potassium channel family protein [Acidimicrobiia bacterium]